MEKIIINQHKQYNYREQFKRLTRAMSSEFYLEAIFIEYAIIEDRTESILKHTGKWEQYLKSRGRYPINLDSKIKYIKSCANEKRALINRYFNDELLDKILDWKENRNRLMHVLLKQDLTTSELMDFAENGKYLADTIRNRVTSLKRVLDKCNKQ